MNNSVAAVILGIVLCSVCPTNVPASATPPAAGESIAASGQLSIQDELERRHFDESPALSPDGRYVAYLISYLGPETRDEGRHREMWLVDAESKRTTLITSACLQCSHLTWSPNGKRIAYFDRVGSGTGIRVWSLDTKTVKTVATDVEQGSLLPWSPDGRFVYARRVSKPKAQVAADKKPEDPSVNGIAVYHSGEHADKEAFSTSKNMESSIIAFDSATGAETTIVRRKGMDFFAVSPNGRFVAWAENTRGFSKPNFYSLTDIGIIALGTGTAKIVARDFRDLCNFYDDGLAWSPDGNTLGLASLPVRVRDTSSTYFAVDASSGSIRLVFTSEHPQWDRRDSILQWVNERQFLIECGSAGRELWIVSIDGRKPYRIYESRSGSIRSVVLGESHWGVWHPKPNTLAIFVRRENDLKLEPVWIDYETGSSTELPAMARFISHLELFPHGVDSASAAVLLEDPTHPMDLWRMAPDGSLDQLTQVNPGIASKRLGTVRLLEWLENGRPKRAALLLPPDYVPGRRYPTVITQYSGIMLSRTLYKFGLDYADGIDQQLYASHGYAVLIPDVYLPVLPKNFNGEEDGSYPSDRPNQIEAIAHQINTAIDYAVQQGYVDPEQLGITGASNGGYGVMCSIVSTPRFKAAIAQAPVVDGMSQSWQFMDGTGIWGPLYEEGYGASLWQDRELYIQNSPFYFLDRVRTPLLLMAGTEDKTVEKQPRQAYIGMKQLGKDVTLVEYEGEGHAVATSYVHQQDLLERMLRFFDEHLRPETTQARSN